MKFFVRGGSMLSEALSASVSHGLTLWCFAAQELLSHPKFPDTSLLPSPLSLSHHGKAQGWDSFGERQHWEPGCSCLPSLAKLTPKLPAPARGCASRRERE